LRPDTPQIASTSTHRYSWTASSTLRQGKGRARMGQESRGRSPRALTQNRTHLVLFKLLRGTESTFGLYGSIFCLRRQSSEDLGGAQGPRRPRLLVSISSPHPPPSKACTTPSSDRSNFRDAKVLQVNKFLFGGAGAETVMFRTADLPTVPDGHEVYFLRHAGLT